MAKIAKVLGNPFALSVALQRQRVTTTSEGVEREVYDFFPAAGHPVLATLQCGAYRQRVEAVMTGNVAVMRFDASLDTGTYGLEVTCTDSDGQQCRWKKGDVVEITDESAQAGLAEGVEFDDTPYHLGVAIFPGVVIADMGGGGGYVKPDSGIPKEDLSEEVQALLDKADKAGTVQSVSVNGGSPTAPDEDGNVDLSIKPDVPAIVTDIADVAFTDSSEEGDDSIGRKVQRAFELAPNTFYNIDGSGDDWFSHTEEDTLGIYETNTLRLALCQYDRSAVQVYAGRFRAPADDTTLVLSTDFIAKPGESAPVIVVDGADDLSIEAGKLYEFNVCADVCIIKCLEGL